MKKEQKNPASLHLAIVHAMRSNLARLSTNKHVNRIQLDFDKIQDDF